MSGSEDLISQLLKAEKEAEEIVANAKVAREEKKSMAKTKAKEELEKFRVEQEKKYQDEIAEESAKAQKEHASAADNKNELDQVEKDYAANKDKTVKYIVEKVKAVNLELTPTQILALETGQV